MKLPSTPEMRIKVQWQAQTYLGTNLSWNKLILEQIHLEQTHLVKET